MVFHFFLNAQYIWMCPYFLYLLSTTCHTLINVAVEDSFFLLIVHMWDNYQPKVSLYLLKKYFQKLLSEPKPAKHDVSSECAMVLSSANASNNTVCQTAGKVVFIYLNIQSQIKELFSRSIYFQALI